MGSFCKNQIKFQLKKYRRLISHGIEEWCKVSRKTDLWFHIWHMEFGDFDPTTQKSDNFTPMGYFCSKYMMFELKMYRGFISHDTEQWCKLWKTLTLWFEELGELSSLEHPKVWKLYIDGLFLSKAYTVSVRNFQRNYVSWHWRVLQSLNENWLVGWKMT